MAVRKKSPKTKADVGKRAVEAFVGAGGDVTPSSSETVRQTLRLSGEIAARVDALRTSQAATPSLIVARNNWIVTAIIEKLEREET